MGTSQMPLHRGVTSPKLKNGVFALEALNALSTTAFFYYVYFYTQAKFGFTALHNLLLAAGLGLIYAVAAFWGGRFAQRFGYFTSVQLGAAIMICTFLAGAQVDGLWPTLLLIVAGEIGLCFTWPALEALMSEGESALRLQSLVGIYNVVWAVFGAIAYFFGGAMLQKWGLKSMFYVPAALLVVELIFCRWLEQKVENEPMSAEADRPLLRPIPEGYSALLPPKVFLRMALLANPLAYLAINTLISTIPSLARRLHFSDMQAGFVCSIWLFVRAAAFVFLRLWPKWHYQFRYLAGAYVAMVISFGAMLLWENVWVLVVTETIFGVAIGLIYYSSLFYSMDVSETKGEHGGIHEAAIGSGNAIGPGIAAGALALFPHQLGAGGVAVCILLLGGLGGLFWIRFQPRD